MMVEAAVSFITNGCGEFGSVARFKLCCPPLGGRWMCEGWRILVLSLRGDGGDSKHYKRNNV